MRKTLAVLAILFAAGYMANARAAAPVVAPPSEAAVMADAKDASYNWAGYVAQHAGSYTAVSGSWVVPTVTAGDASDISADATWVGVGGVSSRDLIQAGTQAITDEDGTVVYQAWWEALPDVSQPLPLAVHPGDSITTALTYIGDGTWQVLVLNNTTGKRAEVTTSYDSSFSSAEWIEESPSLALSSGRGHKPLIPLTNFGQVVFTRGSTVADGTAVSLATSGAEPLKMVAHSGGTLAAPSVMGTAGGFSVVQSDAGTALPAAPHSRVVILQLGL